MNEAGDGDGFSWEETCHVFIPSQQPLIFPSIALLMSPTQLRRPNLISRDHAMSHGYFPIEGVSNRAQVKKKKKRAVIAQSRFSARG